MNDSTHGIEPDNDTPKRKAAGGCNTTTATTKNYVSIVSAYRRGKDAFVRLALWLSVIFRGVA